jgi:hypothetical protein
MYDTRQHIEAHATGGSWTARTDHRTRKYMKISLDIMNVFNDYLGS